jgi:hypothetical protein
MDAATYNRSKFGSQYHLSDLPLEWEGTTLLVRSDLDGDRQLDDGELDALDWAAFSELVKDFQAQAGFPDADVDGKLGPTTLKRLRESFGVESDVLLRVGNLELLRAVEPEAPATGPVPASGSPERRVVASLWNRYGGAIASEAAAAGLDASIALAIFAVESGRAYDPDTGLVIIRFEPAVFHRYAKRMVDASHGSQAAEWRSFQAACVLDEKSALMATSYGLPQLMGFNFGVTPCASARDLLLAFQRSCREQVAGFFSYCRKNKLIDRAMAGDFVGFALRYNGKGKEQAYAHKMEAYHEHARALLGK